MVAEDRGTSLVALVSYVINISVFHVKRSFDCPIGIIDLIFGAIAGS